MYLLPFSFESNATMLDVLSLINVHVARPSTRHIGIKVVASRVSLHETTFNAYYRACVGKAMWHLRTGGEQQQ